MQVNSHKLLSSARQFSSRLVSSAVWVLSAFFAVSGSNVLGANLLCSGLRYSTRGKNTVSNAPIVQRVWYRDSQPHGHFDLWPFLADLDVHYEVANQIFWYYPKGYNWYSSPYPPFTYTPVSLGSTTIPDDWTDNDIKNVLQSSYNSLSLSEQMAVSGATCGNTQHSDGSVDKWVYFSRKPVGTAQNGGIIVYNVDGNPVLGYPDSNGYVHGYALDGVGGTVPAYYHEVDGQVVTVSSLNDVSSATLNYDEETGQYNYTTPDYGPQLSAINDNITKLIQKPLVIDNIELNFPEDAIPAPEVTVNVPAPEVTVNVPSPEVTVNVPAPEVNVNVPAPEVTVNVDNDYSEVVASLDQLVEASYSYPTTNDFSEETFTEEEQELINTAKGWQTNIPVLGEAFDLGLDILIGKIPQMNKTYQLLNLKLLGYDVVCDLEPYKDTIMIFRAFFLLCELIWFFWVLWHDIMNALKV